MFFLIIVILFNECLTIHIRSMCGHPGLPPDATIYEVDPERKKFNDGETIRYRCLQEFHTHKQTRTCKSGRWVGQTARCGVPIENDIKAVEVLDCSHNENNTIVHRKLLDLKFNQSENPLRQTNSFHASRHMSGPISVNGSSCYIWKIKLNRPAMVTFITMDFATELTEADRLYNSTELHPELMTVVPFVSPYRICRSLNKEDFTQFDSETNETFLLRGLYYRCDSITEKEYTTEQMKKSQQMMVEVNTNVERDMHLVAVFLAKHKINLKNGRPDCGRPEVVNTGVNHRESHKSGIHQFQLQCNESFTDVTPNKPIGIKPDHWYTLNCSINGLWEGQFPLCIPKIRCPGLAYLQTHKDQSVDIESIENVYFVNSTYWVAGEHSQVYFICSNPDHIMLGKPFVTCNQKGMWGTSMPKCSGYVRPESLSTVTQSPWTVIGILSVLLLLFLSMVLFIVRKYVTNMRKELMRYRNKSRIQTSIYTDIKTNSIEFIYDDCDNNRFTGFNSKSNHRNKRILMNYKSDTEYIELEADNLNTNTSSEPLYIPILPPT